MMIRGLAFGSLMFSGALFGFFYAWVCSTMWGLDAADPKVAIQAMQAMNASVRNAVFAPVFFGTVVVLAATSLVGFATGHRRAAMWFAAAAIVSLAFNNVLTFSVLIPMNTGLAAVTVPDALDRAAAIWAEYSDGWKLWNQIRAAGTGLALGLAAIGALSLSKRA